MNLKQLYFAKKVLIALIIFFAVLTAGFSAFNLINSGGLQLFGILNTIFLLCCLIGITVLTIVRGHIKEMKPAGSRTRQKKLRKKQK